MEKRRITFSSAFEGIDVVVYGLLGAAVLIGTILKVLTAVLRTGPHLLVIGAALFLITLMATIVRDVYRRRFSWASKGLLMAWVICVLAVVIAEALP